MKQLIRFVMLGLVALLMNACVTPVPMVAQGASPNAAQGYVAGIFYGGKYNYAFRLRNTATDVKIYMPFFEKSGNLFQDEPEQLNMIALPPGRYEITEWVAYAVIGNDRVGGRRLDKDGHTPILLEVKPGRVMYIGKFGIFEAHGAFEHRFGIRPQLTRAAELAWAFEHTYPAFSMDRVDALSGSVRN